MQHKRNAARLPTQSDRNNQIALNTRSQTAIAAAAAIAPQSAPAVPHPGSLQRLNAATRLPNTTGAHPEVTDGVIYLESAKAGLYEDCDQEAPFRQRRPFFYLSGCDMHDSFLTYDILAARLTLHIPPVNAEDVVWSGLPLSPAEAQAQFDVDEVLTTDAAPAITAATTVFAMPSQVARDLPGTVIGTGILKEAIDEARAIKDAYEVALIKAANKITAEAHHACMARIKTAANERELVAKFTQTCIALGAPTQAYTGIFGAGRAAATLHYIKNNQPLAGKLNLLLDAGAELDNYASDVTRTFPISGTFSRESRQIYDIVLKMQNDCIAACKPGNVWDDVHVLAHRIAIEGLLAIGILKGGSVDEILANRTSCAFLPHGLGHYLGMDTHDAGGHPNYEDPDTMFCYLRKRGALPVGAVITVEPGVSTSVGDPSGMG